MENIILNPLALWGRQDISTEKMQRLIEAAPELLDALKALIETDGNDLEVIDLAVALIAKVEGRA